MFATLLLIRDIVSGGREATTLEPGATLASELMRLYPKGLHSSFDVYLREVREESLIPFSEHETYRIAEGERYILVLRPAGILAGFLGYFLVSLLVSVAVAVVAKVLAPKAKQAESNSQTEAISPNNSLAGQTNVLRPGARVPEILGKMRCYPDLITTAREEWRERSQWIEEWFVLGVGRYVWENARLGETSIAGLTGAQLVKFDPYVTVPAIVSVKRSPLVDNLSLLTETATSNAASTIFTPPSTISSTLYLPLVPAELAVALWGTPIRVGNTQYNNALFDLRAAPPASQGTGPFVYTVNGPVRSETATDAIIRPLPYVWSRVFSLLTWYSSGNGDMMIPFGEGWIPVVGQVVRIYFREAEQYPGDPRFHYIGTVVQVQTEGSQYRFWMNNFSGTRIVISSAASWNPHLLVYEDTGDIYTGLAGELPHPGEIISLARGQELLGRANQMYTTWTDWQTAPLPDPDPVNKRLRLIIDWAFPNGLVWYNKGDRKPYTVAVEAQFRKLDGGTSTDSRTWTYTNSTQGALRFTETVTTSSLRLPATPSPYYQVRARRVTAWTPDNNENQYIGDTRWLAFSAGVEIPSRSYGNVTLLQLTLWNTRAAASIGETSFNLIATRVLPTWMNGTWMGEFPSEKWADALVSRMKATDGANKGDAEIDLAGIYNIQRQLDALDGGDQGKIAITLDQQQDIDSELQTIAGIARCQLYRIGPKLYVERDQGGKSAVALFTGRSKHPDGETVSINLTSDADPDAVIVPWWDRRNDGWKQREYQYPDNITPINPMRIAPAQATWAQAYRRARYEWNRLTLRRETIVVKATEEAQLVHPGDVVNIADDVGNLAQTAGELFDVRGGELIRGEVRYVSPYDLQLDQEVDLSSGGYVILLRSLDGRTTDVIGVSQLSPTEVRLARSPRFAIKGRDDALGTMFALYRTERSVVIPWLVTSIEPEERYITISATNWTEAVFAGDSVALPSVPVIPYTAFPLQLMTDRVVERSADISAEEIEA